MIFYLVDTNILLYTLDDRDPTKQDKARRTLLQLRNRNNAGLSAQVLAEYANVTLKKFGIAANIVYTNVEGFASSFTIYPLSPAVILEAVRGVRDHRLSYFDAQIWAVAKLNQIPMILSEDFNPGATLEGVQFLNPLEKSFDLASL